MSEELLNEATVLPYLRGRGLIDDSAAEANLLGGGVSNVVIAIDQVNRRLVLKQSLPRLRVESEWFAPVDRVITEGKALSLAAQILQTGPALWDSDDRRFTITMERADDGWADWKAIICSDRVEAATAGEIGRQIAKIHSNTVAGQHLDRDFLRTEPFELLRLLPYYASTANKAPAQAGRIMELADELRNHRTCLVHGDLSPKNILVGPLPRQVWLIDWEVAHFGDPAFDLAFMITHLTIKSIHFPRHRSAFDAAIDEFVFTYEQESTELDIAWTSVVDHVGCLLMARVLGKSPAEYLNAGSRSVVLGLGRALVNSRFNDLADLRALRDKLTK